MKRENENKYYFVTVKATLIGYYIIADTHTCSLDLQPTGFLTYTPSLPQTVNK